MIKNIAVIGAGTMGNGIAHVFAQKGFSVTLIDVQEAQLEKARQNIDKNFSRQVSKGLVSEEEKDQALKSITYSTSLQEGVREAGLVIEAASENLDIKLNIFRELDEFSAPNTILASNTSSISITKIAGATKRPDRVIGMHFMNPVPVMKLVEIINGYATSAKTTETIIDLSIHIGKTPCVVKDYPGFIANRILMPMINEAIFSLYQGIAGVEEIDTIMKLGMAHPMGPLQLADFIGLDVCHAILTVLYDGFKEAKYAPCPLLTNMVNAGRLGVKSGEGFYQYTPGTKEAVVSPQFSHS